MKKSIKKIISLVIAMALTISGITYSTVAKADETKAHGKPTQLRFRVKDNLLEQDILMLNSIIQWKDTHTLYILMVSLFIGMAMIL